MIVARHACISGLTQHAGRMSGIMATKLAIEHHVPAGHSVLLLPWKHNWARLAEEFFLALQYRGQPPLINVYAYSYGVGWGFVQFAKELRDRGLKINRAVCCDGVYRHGYPWGAWRAFWPFSTIMVPDNVDRVTWFYQRYNLPMGHRIVAEDPKRTQIDAGIQVNAKHQYADDSDEFRATCIAVAKEAGKERGL